VAFQIKDFVSIVASEINAARAATRKVTDFQPGSVMRTVLEAPAVELEELYHQYFIGLREAIPVATFRSFGFERLPEARARGYVTVSSEFPRTQDLLIPARTEFTRADGFIYRSTIDTVWPAGSSLVVVLVEADVPGVVGNAAPGAIVASTFFANSPVTISNQGINTGRDKESDVEREARFADFIAALSRGTMEACLYAARQAQVIDSNGVLTEYVTRSGKVEIAGRVSIFLYSSVGSPTDALLADAQRRLDGWRDTTTGVITPGFRPAGVRVDALRMVERAVSLSIRVAMLPGAVLSNEVVQRMRDIFSSAVAAVQPEETLFLGTVVEMLLNVPGVRAIVPVSTENYVCEANEVLIPGSFTASSL